MGAEDSIERGIRVLQETALSSEMLLEALWSNIPFGVSVIDKRYRLLHCNEIFRCQCRLTMGDDLFISLSEAPGDSLLKEQIDRVFRQGERRSATESRFSSEQCCQRTVHHFPIKNRSGDTDSLLSLWPRPELPGQVSVHGDSFASILSHELRTPLNFITGFASLLDEEVSGPLKPEQHHFVDRVLDGSQRMAEVIENLLECTSFSQKEPEIRPRSASMKEAYELCRAAVEACQPKADAKGHEVSLAISPPLPQVQFDAAALQRALCLLLENSIKFTPPGGSIRLSVEGTGGAMVFKLGDNGTGIPSEKLSRIFDPFYQADMTNTRKAGGMGIGLCLVSRIVAAHKGSLGAETASDGALFWFAIPSSEEAALSY